MKKYFYSIKLAFDVLREFKKGNFAENSSTVKSYALLILSGKISINDVPDISNLRESTESFLTK